MGALVKSLGDRMVSLVVPRKTALARCEPGIRYYCTIWLCGESPRRWYRNRCMLFASCEERCATVDCMCT